MSQEPFAQAGNPPAESSFDGGEESISLANTNDQASREDWLGFAPYVTAIADFLTSNDTKPPLVMSVEGEWGSGKTSFMRQLEHALRKERKQRITVWFNPWRHDKEDAVWAAFALEFIRGISRSQWFGRRWIGHLRLFLRRFRWEQGWLDFSRKIILWILILGLTTAIGIYGIANRGEWTYLLGNLAKEITQLEDLQSLIANGLEGGGILAYLAIWLSLLHKLSEFVGDPLKIDLKKYVNTPNYQERVSFVERFHEDFRHIVEAYAGKDTVYVFIDDVDRCEVPKAADLMSTLNLMISGETRLVFIIGMDREKVAAGLAVKHEKLLPYLQVSRYDAMDDLDKDTRLKLMGLEFGYEFIEKFVQLPFIVPRPDDVALGAFLKNISETSGRVSIAAPVPAPAQSRMRALVSGVSPDSSLNSFISESLSQRQRRESIKIQAGTDSNRIHNIIRVVAPAFENNPRRLKQFINLFRLRVYIAAETGLFDYKQVYDLALSDKQEYPFSFESKELTSLTLEQLGKFVAINLRWPLLLADMEYAPSLLNDLQKLAIDMKAEVATPASRLSRWRHRPDLLSFLAAGMPDNILKETEKILGVDLSKSRWSLENVDFAEIMRVSPRVRRVVGEEAVVMVDKGKTPVIEPSTMKAGGLISIASTYVFGDDLYDDSFSINTDSGEFLGEMGCGTFREIQFPGTPNKFGAFEVWLFDKNDIRTQTKILMSEFAFNNPEIRAKTAERGEHILALPDQQKLVLETETLRVNVTIRELAYGNDPSAPRNSYFERLTVEMSAFQKERSPIPK